MSPRLLDGPSTQIQKDRGDQIRLDRGPNGQFQPTVGWHGTINRQGQEKASFTLDQNPRSSPFIASSGGDSSSSLNSWRILS